MRYHERSKHHFNRFAGGPGGLDWANQPDPFRRYAGAALTRLPILGPRDPPLSPAYESLYVRGAVPAAAVLFHKLPADVRSVGVVLSGGNMDFETLQKL